jgi:hypothetical protein
MCHCPLTTCATTRGEYCSCFVDTPTLQHWELSCKCSGAELPSLTQQTGR